MYTYNKYVYRLYIGNMFIPKLYIEIRVTTCLNSHLLGKVVWYQKDRVINIFIDRLYIKIHLLMRCIQTNITNTEICLCYSITAKALNTSFEKINKRLMKNRGET